MVAHQFIAREKERESEQDNVLFCPPDGVGKSLDDAELAVCSYRAARSIILRHEWLGTMPSGFRFAVAISWRGWIGGVVVFGSPNPMQIANSVFGGWRPESVVQIHRGACVWWAHRHSASRLIAYGLKMAEQRGYRAAVAFSDPEAGEVGTVYQATNWTCCGLTAERPDYFENGKRVVGCFAVRPTMTREPRPRKYRYVALLGSRGQQREARTRLAWPACEYPKRKEASVEIETE